ncbi:hypothetical protein FKM82_004002 [Ascaphus truei]
MREGWLSGYPHSDAKEGPGCRLLSGAFSVEALIMGKGGHLASAPHKASAKEGESFSLFPWLISGSKTLAVGLASAKSPSTTHLDKLPVVCEGSKPRTTQDVPIIQDSCRRRLQQSPDSL